ncbi:MAG: hypothetical protein E7Z89_07490 [Cyanobacteria bacterium SIG28]|nr:hypothetical protein [Cyanobacteria bacterium SIG28]
MSSIAWRFPPLSGGTRQGYTNNDIEVFKGNELIDNLAREICQNSLDAHSDDSNSPVKVVFELKKFAREDYDVFAGYSECLQGCREYWGEEMDAKLSRFISNAEKTLTEDKIPVLIASDYNTKGLSGSRSHKISSSWEALTGSDGVSVKQDENSAGSYGIGKNAPFACSSLSMVFYNTMAEDMQSAFIGVARLATLNNAAGEPTQRVGKYQCNDEENKCWKPIYDNDKNGFRDCFKRTGRGTDVIIVGFNQEPNWIKNVTQAVLKNFFVAISENRLIVELKDGNENTIIDGKSLPRLFSDFTCENIDMISAAQLYNAFTKPDNKRTLDVFDKEDVEIYVKSDTSYNRTIANFRATGMLVGTYYRRIFQHYAAVVIVRGNELGELLKDTEPPRHNRWDYKQIETSDKEKRKKARDAIRLIEDSVLSFLKEQFEVVTEDTIDAAGVGEYLADDLDDFGEMSEGDDILKTKVKIGKIKINKTISGITTQSAKQDEGTKQKGDVNDEDIPSEPTPNPPKPKPPKPLPPMPKPPKPDIVDPDEQDGVLGVSLGAETKIVSTPILLAQRAFPINAAQGIYKVVIKPKENSENLFAEFYAVGEDGKYDLLDLVSFKYNGVSLRISNGKTGPFSVKAETPAVFYAVFKNKEKMKLSIHLTEEVKL